MRTGASRPNKRVPAALRLVLVTDGRGDIEDLTQLVRAAVAGGVRSVQLREPKLTARELAQLCDRLRPDLDQVDGLLLVNDRVDVVLAGHAHGVQLGYRSLAPAEVRPLLGQDFVMGVSVHDDVELAAAAAAGADFVLLSPILPTRSKPGSPGVGPVRAGRWTAGSSVPVVWLGGMDAVGVAAIADLPADARPIGIAVQSALCSAPEVTAAAQAILAAMAAAIGG